MHDSAPLTESAATTDAPSLDVEAVRAQFPYLERDDDVVYLDSGASAQKPRAVLDAMYAFGGSHYANIHRGVHVLAREADAAFDAARETVAAFVGSTARETIFTGSVTQRHHGCSGGGASSSPPESSPVVSGSIIGSCSG